MRESTATSGFGSTAALNCPIAGRAWHARNRNGSCRRMTEGPVGRYDRKVVGVGAVIRDDEIGEFRPHRRCRLCRSRGAPDIPAMVDWNSRLN